MCSLVPGKHRQGREFSCLRQAIKMEEVLKDKTLCQSLPSSSGEDTQGETWHLVSPSKSPYPLPNPELLREAGPACGLRYHQPCRQTPSTAPGCEPTWETTMGAATSLGTNWLPPQSHQHIPSTGTPLGLHGAGSTMHPLHPRSVTEAPQRSAAPLSPFW